MKKGSYPWKNNGKNRELRVYNTIVSGKMLNSKVNVDWIKIPKCIGNDKTTLLEQQHLIMVENLCQRKKKYGISWMDFQTIEKTHLEK